MVDSHSPTPHNPYAAAESFCRTATPIPSRPSQEGGLNGYDWLTVRIDLNCLCVGKAKRRPLLHEADLLLKLSVAPDVVTVQKSDIAATRIGDRRVAADIGARVLLPQHVEPTTDVAGIGGQNRPGIVIRAIIDSDNLEITKSLAHHTVEGFSDGCRRVIARNNDANRYP